MRRISFVLIAALAGGMALSGCQTAMNQPSASAQPAAVAGPYDKAGFQIEVDDGRLWVLKPGQEKSGKHVAMIGAGRQNATLRATDMETLERYLAYRP